MGKLPRELFTMRKIQTSDNPQRFFEEHMKRLEEKNLVKINSLNLNNLRESTLTVRVLDGIVTTKEGKTRYLYSTRVVPAHLIPDYGEFYVWEKEELDKILE